MLKFYLLLSACHLYGSSQFIVVDGCRSKVKEATRRLYRIGMVATRKYQSDTKLRLHSDYFPATLDRHEDGFQVSITCEILSLLYAEQKSGK